MNDLFSEREWFGEFYIPGQYEKRFPGKLVYSPESGVRLNYSITGQDVPTGSEELHGVLHTGDKCTLIGRLAAEYAGFTYRKGLHSRHGIFGFRSLLLGDFSSHDELFFDLEFSLVNMQEFFFPIGHKDRIRYSDKPLFSLKTSYGEIEIDNRATFGYLLSDITSQIYNWDPSALEELKNAFAAIKATHPKSLFMLKNDIRYHIRLKIDAGATFGDAYAHITNIANLFALLIHCPVYPETIYLVKKENSDRPLLIEVFPSMVLDKRTITICKADRSHFSMPITQFNVDLPGIMKSWLETPLKYGTVITAIQHKTGIRDLHSLHGDIVLYATQFDSISHEAGIDPVEKYTYPLKTFSSYKVISGVQKILSNVGESDFGKGIADLRNEIAHVGKPKRLLAALTIRDLGRLTQFMEVTVLGSILTTLGVKKDVIEHYQDISTPDV